MANIEKQMLTEEGKKKYEEELAYLIDVVRPQVTQEIKEAKEQGDLSENADYDAARNKQAEVEARIKDLEFTLNNVEVASLTHAEIISTDKSSNVVTLGCKVKLNILDEDVEEEYLIVGPAEADPESGKISNACKLALAILNHKAGETVTVKVDNPYQVKIIAITK